MHRFIKWLENAVRNPYVELFVGLILIVTGLSEAGENIFSDVSSGNLGAHHGVIALGFAHCMKAIPSMLAAIMMFAEADHKSS